MLKTFVCLAHRRLFNIFLAQYFWKLSNVKIGFFFLELFVPWLPWKIKVNLGTQLGAIEFTFVIKRRLRIENNKESLHGPLLPNGWKYSKRSPVVDKTRSGTHLTIKKSSIYRGKLYPCSKNVIGRRITSLCVQNAFQNPPCMKPVDKTTLTKYKCIKCW